MCIRRKDVCMETPEHIATKTRTDENVHRPQKLTFCAHRKLRENQNDLITTSRELLTLNEEKTDLTKSCERLSEFGNQTLMFDRRGLRMSCDRLSTSSGESSEKERFRHLAGQLNICIYENSGLLTVHVVQAKRLKSKWKALSDSYVKISLVPDLDRRSRCKTGLVRDSNNPSYDQKFSFELFPEDYKKRLLVSCWHRDDKNGRSEFLGCMSFGMKNILSGKSQTDGWYYLLTEETGRRKHLQAPPERSYMRPASQYALRTSYIL